jgi:hypothetical protein
MTPNERMIEDSWTEVKGIVDDQLCRLMMALNEVETKDKLAWTDVAHFNHVKAELNNLVEFLGA